MKHALAALLGVVQQTIRAEALLEVGDRVLVAVSGGPDSTGLLLALSQLSGKLGIELLAAHVNHGLRGSDAGQKQLLWTVTQDRLIRQLRQDVHEAAAMSAALSGPDTLFLDGAGATTGMLVLLHRAMSIAGGTSEIKRNQIGERILGLPRDPLIR